MTHPDLDPIIEIMKCGKDFELTSQQYKKKTKADLLLLKENEREN